MKKFIFTSMMLAAVVAHSQTQKLTDAADTIKSSQSDKTYKVKTCYEKVFNTIMAKYEGKATRYNVAYRTDRMGRYKEYTIYFPIEAGKEIEAYVSTLPRQLKTL